MPKLRLKNAIVCFVLGAMPSPVARAVGKQVADPCKRAEVECKKAERALSDAEGCMEWVRQGTYKNDGSVMTPADCAWPDELREAKRAACDKRNDCQRGNVCRAAISSKPPRPVCTYGGEPGVWNCHAAIKGCADVLIDGVSVPCFQQNNCAAARAFRAVLIDTVNGWSNAIDQRLEEFGCERGTQCQRAEKCAESARSMIEKELAACNCEDAGSPQAREVGGEGWSRESQVCSRAGHLPRDADTRATLAVVAGFTSDRHSPCVLLDKSTPEAREAACESGAPCDFARSRYATFGDDMNRRHLNGTLGMTPEEVCRAGYPDDESKRKDCQGRLEAVRTACDVQ